MDEPRITKAQGFFWMTCRVDVIVQAEPPRVWEVLTAAADFPRRNSTVANIDGEIREGAHLRLRVPGSDRVFTPIVSGVLPASRMTWTGGVTGIFKGVRTFTLTPHRHGATGFAMEERFAGGMLPVVRRWLPDFGPIFAQYANDLKREVEAAPLRARVRA